MYIYAASNLDNLFNKCKINIENHENVWNYFKFLISEYTHILADSSIDFIIILSVYLSVEIFDIKLNTNFDNFNGKCNKHLNVLHDCSKNKSSSLIRFLISEYIECNKNDYSNIIKNTFINSNIDIFVRNISYNSEENNTFSDFDSSDTFIQEQFIFEDLQDPKLIKKMKKEINNFIANRENKDHNSNYDILWDYSKFLNYKNLIAYSMNTIFSYSPNITVISKGQSKTHSNVTLIKGNYSTENKTKFDNESFNNNTISVISALNNEIKPISNFFANQVLNKNSNINVFLNTKRIKKITTPISTKIINSSPFKEKTKLLIKKNNSAFRNLQNQFDEK